MEQFMEKILPPVAPSEGIMQAVEDFNYVWASVRGPQEDRTMIAMNLLGIMYAPIPQFHPIPEGKIEDGHE